MVFENYLLRQALGRSAYEPEHTQDGADANSADEEPAPVRPMRRSRNVNSREQRRAQNTILEVVGVVTRHPNDESHNDEGSSASENFAEDHGNVDKTQLFMNENDEGFFLTVMTDFSAAIATTFISNVRRRIQTFAFYSQLSGQTFVSCLEIDAHARGLSAFFFGGLPLIQALNFAESVLGSMQDLLDAGSLTYLGPDRRQSRGFRMASGALQYAVLPLLTCFLVLPVRLHAPLQRLGLAPPFALTDLFRRPGQRQLLFTPLPATLSFASSVHWARQCLSSPIVTFAALDWIRPRIETTFVRYLRTLLQRPDNPDPMSCAVQEEHDDPVVRFYPRQQKTWREELRRDKRRMRKTVRDIREIGLGTWRLLTHFPSSLLSSRLQGQPHEMLSADASGNGENHSHLVGEGDPPSEVPTYVVYPPQPSDGEDQPLTDVTADAPNSPEVPPPNRTQSDGGHYENGGEPADESRALVPVLSSNRSLTTGPAAEDHTQRGEQGYLEGRVSQAMENLQNSLHGDTRESDTESESFYWPLHHVSGLSLTPSAILTQQLGHTLMVIVCLPLESLALRSLASRWLKDMPDAPEKGILAECIYGLGTSAGWGFWNSAGARRYVRNLVFCIAIEQLISWSFWRAASEFAKRRGEKAYGWNKF